MNEVSYFVTNKKVNCGVSGIVEPYYCYPSLSLV